MTSFLIYSPGGCPTALVPKIPDDKSAVDISRRIIKQRPEIEQVGFVESYPDKKNKIRLQMMGGEFCVDAARAAGMWWIQKQGIKKVEILVSGFPETVVARIEKDKTALELPKSFMRNQKFVPEGLLVEFEGISFLVTKPLENKSDIPNIIGAYSKEVPAMGLIELNDHSGFWSIIAHVFVKDMGKIVRETACGSGSIAAALSLYAGGIVKDEYQIRQSGGSIYTVSLNLKNGQPSALTLSGDVGFIGTESLK